MNRFEKKLDHFLWFIILILPIVLYIVCCWGVGNSATPFDVFIEPFTFDFIEDIFTSVLYDNFALSTVLTSYISYLFSVELIHLFYDCMVFIIRIGHKWISKFWE